MDTTREKAFYEALGVVPEIPAEVLEKVERSVRHSGVKRRTTLAACLLLTLIIPAVVVLTTRDNVAAYADDGAMDELLYAIEFLNGGSDADDGEHTLLDVVQGDAVVIDSARQLPLSELSGEQLTKKSTEKGLPNER